ncbi:hypothetical protein GFS31_21600 [Leptolyngbya sp. BL0902]|uniref:DUF4912 domain-containing protein n=1 Tax=Leptolyngbya sp. BL0902 TaxID=1115757 RepID=UPI0018E8CE86|nr:DUF4912 domain-containing protein [Leptolyngbya sp. BL0902]QQE65472.1 hypothetical protein GFS31_21600 [Leptolyngbya sp. BL0902]
MEKLPRPSLFVLSLIGALAVGPSLEGVWQGEEIRATVGFPLPLAEASSMAQAPAPPPPTSEIAAAPPVLALSPDGQYLVRGTATGDLVWLDDQGQATAQTVAQAHRGAVLAVVISRDGQTVISAGADGAVRRWDRQGNALGEAILSQGSPLTALALSPDGQGLIAGRADGLVEPWSLATGTAQGDPVAAHAAAIQSLDYMSGGQNWVSGSQDGSLALWNADGSPAGRIPSAHGGGVSQVVSSPDGQGIVSAGGDGTLRFWDRVTFQPRGETLAAHGAPIRAVAYSPDSRTLATAAADGSLRLWNIDGTSRWSEPVMLDSEPRFLGFTPAGDLVVGTVDGRVERRGPQGNVVALTRAQAPSSEDPVLSPPDGFSALQNLPQNTWWILAAVPALLILAGAVGALLGGRSPEEETAAAGAEETDLGPEPRAHETDEADEADEAKGTAADLDPRNYHNAAMEAGIGEADASEGVASRSVQPLANPTDAQPPALPPEADLSWDWAETTPTKATSLQADPANPLPPEASLVADRSTNPQPPANKLEQARADLAGGRQQLRAGQYEAALLCFNSAIEATEVERLKAEALSTPMGGINALATQAQTQRGHALGLLDQPSEAMESYNTALGLDSAALEAWVGKGRLLMALGRYEEALFCFDSALELDSSLGPAWAGKGQALLRLGRHAEGQTCHHRAIALGLESLGPLPPYPTLDPDTGRASDDAAMATINDPVFPLEPLVAAPSHGDPDVPLALQQVVMGLPSADTDLAYAFPSDYGVPPELMADVADLPSQAENSVEAPTWPSTSAEPSPLSQDLGTAPWVEPIPEDREAEDSPTVKEVDPSHASDLSVENRWNPDQGWPTPKATALDPSALDTPSGSRSISSGAAVSPSAEAAPGNWPGNWGASWAAEASAELIPPVEFDENWPQDLPPEVIAAMASIPAGSPDAFGPLPPVSPPTPPPVAALIQSGITLTLDRSQGPRFYALWHIEEEDRIQAKQAGGEILAVRLYDVTGHPTQTPLPPPVEEQRCHDDFAQDWYLAIPRWNRIYLAEIGYLSSRGQWQALARSSEVPALANG